MKYPFVFVSAYINSLKLYSRPLVFLLLSFLLMVFSPQHIWGQCTPTISISGGSSDFCVLDNTNYILTVSVTPTKSYFSGPGVTDVDSTDNVAIFNPSTAGAIGALNINFNVLIGGGGSSCMPGNFSMLPIMINDIPDAGTDGIDSVCLDGSSSVILFNSLSGAPQTVGTWVGPVGTIGTNAYLGELHPDSIATLAYGNHTFKYIIYGIAPCVNDTSEVILTVVQIPIVTGIDIIPDVCENEKATVTILGSLLDGSYEVDYLIDGSPQPQEIMIVSGGPNGTFNSRTLTVAADSNKVLTVLKVRRTDAAPYCATDMIYSMPLTVNPLPTGSIMSSDPNDTICVGEIITFTGVGGTMYEFLVNGLSASGPNVSANYVTDTLNHNDGVTVVVFDGNSCSDTSATIITAVIALPSITLTIDDADSLICVGDAVTYTATGGGMYEFLLNGVNVSGPGVLPTYTTSGLIDGDQIRVAVISVNGCVDTSAALPITVSPLPTAALLSDAPGGIICAGDTVIFTGSGGMTYEFILNIASLGPATAMATYTTNTLNTLDSVKVVAINPGGCRDTSLAIITTVNALPVAGISSDDADNIICAGDSVIFTATGGPNYEFFLNNVSLGASGLADMDTLTTLMDGDEVKVILVNASGCIDTSAIITTTVSPLPIANLGSSDADNIICQGDTVIFTGGGGTTYEFFLNDVSLGMASVTSTYITSTLNNGDQIKVAAFNPGGCSDTIAFPITMVIARPTATLVSSDPVICVGDTVIFTATGGGVGGAYEFFLNGTSLGVPGADTYTTDSLINADNVMVIVYNSNLCRDTSIVIPTTVNALPTATISSNDVDNTICAGDTVIFTGGGGGTYQFLLNDLPIAGATGITYTTDSLNHNDVIKIVVTNGSGCKDTSIAITTVVFALPIPTLVSSDPNDTICVGDLVVFTASGGGIGENYEFLLNNFSVSGPSVSATYSTSLLVNNDEVKVIISNAGGCFDTSTIIKTVVNALPISTLSSNDPNDTICIGDEVIFTAGFIGGATYEFLLNDVSLGAATAMPTYTTDTLAHNDGVKVVITNISGCQDTSIAITTAVNALPAATLTSDAINDTICLGDIVIFTASGAGIGGTYEFIKNSMSVSGPSLVPTYTTSLLNNKDTIGVIINNGSGCIDTSTVIIITVNNLPAAGLTSSDLDNIICVGESVTFTGTGGVMYEFLLNNVSVASASSMTTYTTDSLNILDEVKVIAINANGCIDTSIVITTVVTPDPTAGLGSNDIDNIICQGDSVVFTGTGGTMYEFLLNGNSLAPKSSTTTYSTDTLINGDQVRVVVFNVVGCQDTSAIITTTVNALPIPILTSDDLNDTICLGDIVIFTASGGGIGATYEFLLNNVLASGPSALATYTTDSLNNGDEIKVIIANANGCIDSSTVILTTVNPLPIAGAITGAATQICIGSTLDLNSNESGGTGALVVNWFSSNNGIATVGATGLITPVSMGNVNISYTVSDSNACSVTSNFYFVSIDSLPTAIFTTSDADSIICEGETVVFTGGGGLDYEFLLNGNSIGLPSSLTTYTTDSLNNGDQIRVVVINSFGCMDTSGVISMTVNTLPVAMLNSSDGEICAGETVTFTASGGDLYEFFINDVSIGINASTTYVTDTLMDSDNVKVSVITLSGCSDTSTVITTIVNPLPVAGNIMGPNQVCMGSTIDLNSNQTGGTGGLVVNWLSSSNAVATVDPSGIITPVDTGLTFISYSVIDAKFCNAISIVHPVQVDSIPVPSLIVSDVDSMICKGDAITFTAGGGSSYMFLLNNVPIGMVSPLATYTTDTLNNNDTVKVVVFNIANCSNTSGAIIMTVNPLPIAALSSNDIDNMIGTGQEIIFTGTGGTEYQFLVNQDTLQTYSVFDTFTINTLNHLDTVIVAAKNGNGCIDTASIVIIVNAPPIALNDTISLPEDTASYNILVQLNDTDPEGDLLVTNLVIDAINGSSSILNFDSIQYTPDLNFNGIDSIQYSVCDIFNNCDTAIVYITVTPVNDVPNAVNDTLRIFEDALLDTVHVQLNDSDIDGDVLVTTIFSGPGTGIGAVIGDTSISYVPLLDSNGTDVIVYKVCDPSGACGFALLFIEITPVNDRPIANKDSITIYEDSMNVKVAILANDIDVDGDIINLDSVFAPTSGGAVVVVSDTVIYNPPLNYFGIDSIKYIICDGALCDSTYLIINVLPINEPPIAVVDSIEIPEDTTTIKIAFLANDIEVDGDSLIVDSLYAAASGATIVLVNDTICYTPPMNFSGLDSIKYVISDTVFKDSTYIFINVLPFNDTPIAVNDTVSMFENSVNFIIAVQANDVDPDGDLMVTTIVSGSGPTQGMATVIANNVIYTPLGGFNGADSITYSICDIGIPSLCDTAKIYITVNGINDRPLAVNDTICIPEDTMAVLVAVEMNDIDIDGDPLSVTILTNAIHSMIDSIRNDTLVYMPASDFEGKDSVYYRVSDGFAHDSAWVIITVKARNDAPIAVSDLIVVTEDTANVQFAILQNDIDIDKGDTIKATILVMPTSGGVATILDDTLLNYTPAFNFYGVDTIVYEICDTSSACDADTIFITVSPFNDAPIAVDDVITVPEDSTNIIIDVQANDSDPDGDILVTHIFTTVMMSDTLNGDSIILSPFANSNGIQLVAYIICDPLGLCDTGKLTVFVTPVNDAPVAVNDLLLIPMDTTNVMVDVLGNDTDIDDLVLTVGNMPVPTAMNGTVSIVNDSILYTPTFGYSGIDTITYTVCDSSNACAQGLVIVMIGFVNSPPVAVNDTFPFVSEDATFVTLDVLANDSDINLPNDSLKITLLTTPENGSAIIIDDTLINYIPLPNFNGKDSLQYTVCDAYMGCTTAWIFITVNAINDAPIAINDTFSLSKDTMNALLHVKINDSDPDGDVLILSIIGVSTQGITATIITDSINYSAPGGFVGVDTLKYRVFDGVLYDTALVIIVIDDPNNMTPIANTDFATTMPSDAIVIDVQANDVDPNGDILNTSILYGPKVGNVATILNGDSIQYTPAVSFVGIDTIIYQVCDPSFTCDSDTVFISVTNSLAVSVKVILGGSWSGGLLMYDSLRKKNLIPATEPYSTLPHLIGKYEFIHKNGGGGETIANPATVFANIGANSIVDWVYLELLTGTDTIPVASRSALVQRDGDVVDIDGVSPVKFEFLPDGIYFLSIRHRNHLGVMTKIALPFANGSFTAIDFTQAAPFGTEAYGINPMQIIGSKLVLWAGDGNADRKIIYDGIANDRDPIFFNVITDLINVNSNYNHISTGYYLGDSDMKGSAVYLGSGNDPDILFFKVFTHPENGLGSTIFIFSEQIPR